MSSLSPGRILGHYEILAKIGEGGMGEVYRARDIHLGREIAVKVLPPDVAADPVRRNRFEQEAKAVAALNHPHIVTLHSIEEAAGVRFLTMELLDGQPLSARIASRKSREGPPPSIAECVDLALPIVDAIAAAHARGITHRDLKPQNIVITADGRPKILDFGLAKQTIEVIDGETPTHVKTEAGLVLGTLHYMSPEQALGEEVDHRSDLFSLGVVLYEMTTGRRPFGGDTVTRVIDGILHGDVPSMDADRAGSREVEQIIRKCLEKDRDRRYQSAAELRLGLQQVRSALTMPEPGAVRSDREHRMLKVAGIAAAVLLAAMASFVAVRLSDRSRVAVAEAAVIPKTIAVLPFRNLSADAENAFFAQGVHEDVMTRLAGIAGLRVISRTSVLRLSKEATSLREIGSRLDARYIVEGSVRRAGNEVRVAASLVDTETDQTLWSAAYDRELVSVFALQSALAQEIATRLEAKIGPADRRRLDAVPTRVVRAYDDYLRARGILNQSRRDLDALQTAIVYLGEATKADPNFADAWSLVARAWSERVQMLRELDGRDDDVRAATAEANGALDRARELAPRSVSTLRAAGYFHELVETNAEAALRSLDAALALVPHDSETLLLQSLVYLRTGRTRDVVKNLEKAYAVDSANGLVIYSLTFAYEASRQYAKMPAFFEHLLALEPDKTHYRVHARYYQFLADGKISSFKALEEAIRTLEKTARCDLRSVQNREMVVALVNRDFDRYARQWEGKWTAHQRGHGNWACPAQLNEEANHAAMLRSYGRTELARSVVDNAMNEAGRPYTERSGLCIFDRGAFQPKLDFMSGDREKARRDLDDALKRILANQSFPRGAIERAVLLETVDMVAPERVYDLYREIASDPRSLLGIEVVCANPWTYPNLLKDPRFAAEVRSDGRFVEFLQTHGHFAL